MRIVLLKNVSGLGEVGDVKEVADGYGRNFLIPKGLAEFATPTLLKRAEEQRRSEEHRQFMAGAEMAGLEKTLEGLEVTIKAKVGATDRLYGAITSADIAEEVQRLTGQDIDKRKIELDEPIHHLGEYEVSVRLSTELVPRLKVVITEEQVEVKAKKKVRKKTEKKAEDATEEAVQAMTVEKAKSTEEETAKEEMEEKG